MPAMLFTVTSASEILPRTVYDHIPGNGAAGETTSYIPDLAVAGNRLGIGPALKSHRGDPCCCQFLHGNAIKRCSLGPAQLATASMGCLHPNTTDCSMEMFGDDGRSHFAAPSPDA